VSRQVAVVGGGVAGLCTAYALARRGHAVTVLDEGTAEGGGCSYGNAGMIVPSHFVPLAAPGMVALGLRWMWSPESPFYIRPRPRLELLRWGLRFWRSANASHVARAAPLLRDLHLRSRRLFEEWSAAWGDGFGLTTTGLLMMCRTAHGLEEEGRAAEEARRLGIPAEVLTPAQTAERDPGLRLSIAGAVHYPLDAFLSPDRLMAGLQRESQRAGARICWGTRVTGWRTQGRRVAAALTGQGAVEADEYVLAAGIWSTPLARDLGLRLPMQAGKGYTLTLPHPARRPRLCAILSEARVAVTPMGQALRIGGTMELTGWEDPRRIAPARVRGILRSVAQYYPELTAEQFRDVPAWAGLRPCPPDGLPYLGRVARFENLSAATGHSMMGVSLGPVTGELMAQILSGEQPSLDVAPLRPDRFA
jgi:D-amino-acid dehydrogenase